MIYVICEYLATAIECIILCLFLILSLHYKTASKAKRITGTLIFIIFFLANAIFWDNAGKLFSLEQLHIFSYIIILFIFAQIMLKGKWWHQIVIILISIGSVFLINIVVAICSSIILQNNYSEIMLMRNPTRIFLLVATKVALTILLFSIGNLIKKKHYFLHLMQCVFTIIVFVISIVVGVTIEKMLLDNIVALEYATIIMICLSIISILLFFILTQTSIQNQSELTRIALQTRLHDDDVRINELLQWNASVRTLRHDLNNHLIVIKHHIIEQDYENSLAYIEKIEESIADIPQLSNTNNSTLNAILDVKRIICHNEHIDLKCYLQNDLPEFDSFSFSTILGNLIDNAIEAEKKETKKEIRLSIVSEHDCIRITIQNRISKSVLVNGHLLITSKKDKKNHGLGMLSVSEIISQNNGAIDIYEKENWFIVDVLMQTI